RRQVEQTRGPELESTDLPFWRTGAGMIPRTDDQVVTRMSPGRSTEQVLAIVLQRSRLLVIIDSGNRQNGYIEPRILLRSRIMRIPILVWFGMRQPLLENRQRLAQHSIQIT